MRPPLRQNRDGVASTIATLLTLLVILMVMQAFLFDTEDTKRYDAEWETSREAVEAFGTLRSVAAGPGVPRDGITVPVPLGTHPVSPFSSPSPGSLSFESTVSGPAISLRFVPSSVRAEVQKVDQDVILLMDTSSSMVCCPNPGNDPGGLRFDSAIEYVSRLTCPDRVAIVDFHSTAKFTRYNEGGQVRHLDDPSHNCSPDYSSPIAELDEMRNNDDNYPPYRMTNFAHAIQIANDEFRDYGDPSHAWVMILLTDGFHCLNPNDNYPLCPGSRPTLDAIALAEAGEARALGVRIYTIGLGSALDPVILQNVAQITGGTYYHAQNAEDIRWIYLELSRLYSSSFVCGDYTVLEGSGGLLSLALGSTQYPAQTIRMEGGAISLTQPGGSLLVEGPPITYQESENSSFLSITMITFLGPSQTARGLEPEFVRLRAWGQETIGQTIDKVALDEEVLVIQNISDEIRYWETEGAVTSGAADEIDASLTSIANWLQLANANYTIGNIDGAKNDIDRAKANLTAAEDVVKAKDQSGEIVGWLAEITIDHLRFSACRLRQWLNWYDGIMISVNSPAAAAWSEWFTDLLTARGASFSSGFAGTQAVVTIHTVDELLVDRRVVEIDL